MSDLEQIQRKAQEQNLECLLIGGLAVIEHGFARLTTDIDLIVRARCRDSWKTVLAALDYRLINEQDNFQQYERSEDASWPLDLKLVNDNQLNLHSAEIRDLFIKYGSVEIYDKIRRLAEAK